MRTIGFLLFVGCALLLAASCHHSSRLAKNKDTKQMQNETIEVVVKDERGAVVARMHKRGEVLHGLCEWYDRGGRLVAHGVFREGRPYSGTFLNFTSYFEVDGPTNPYEANYHARDWISAFEMTYASARPQYHLLRECYTAGKRVPCAH